MARHKLAALLAAAGGCIVIGISAAGHAADDPQGQGAQLPASGQSQQQPQTSERSSPGSQGMGGTSGAASTGALQANPDRSMQDSRSAYENTYLTPYEIRTPGPRDNVDD